MLLPLLWIQAAPSVRHDQYQWMTEKDGKMLELDLKSAQNQCEWTETLQKLEKNRFPK